MKRAGILFAVLAVMFLLSGCAARGESPTGRGYRNLVPLWTYPAAGAEIELGIKF